MLKRIVTLICALALTACGSMSHMRSGSSSGYSGSGSSSDASGSSNSAGGSSGYSGQSSQSGYGGSGYASGSENMALPVPGALGSGTLGVSGP
jgi:hypothetical protein